MWTFFESVPVVPWIHLKSRFNKNSIIYFLGHFTKLAPSSNHPKFKAGLVLGGCRNWLQPGLYWVVDYRNLGLQPAGCSKGAEVATPVHGCNPSCFWGVANQIYTNCENDRIYIRRLAVSIPINVIGLQSCFNDVLARRHLNSDKFCFYATIHCPPYSSTA